MSVKESVLSMLESHRGEDFSGEELAQSLGVTRAAVWKAIQSLKAAGYPITAATNRGYRLSAASDQLSAEGVRAFLPARLATHPLFVYPTIDSTNKQAKLLALEPDSDHTAVIADTQTAGRGRFGRSFFSPEGCGIYLSVVLHPTPAMLADVTLLTTATAVALCRAITRTTGRSPEIKWVNDLLLGGKKIAGILTEAVTDFETREIRTIVIGCGINVKDAPNLPAELSEIVGSIWGKDTPAVSRNALVAAMLTELDAVISTLSTREFLQEYRERCGLLGQEIVFSRGEKTITARAKQIDEDGGLVIAYSDGTEEVLRAGEVSVRPWAQRASLPHPDGAAR